MKKILTFAVVFIAVFLTVICPVCMAEENDYSQEVVQEAPNSSKLSKVKEEASGKLEQYTEKYGGSKAYGMTALVLNTVRKYSIPFCFVGIIIGSIYQYVIGIRRLDIRDKGFNLIIAFVTLLVIAQILPLVFAIVTRGWIL